MSIVFNALKEFHESVYRNIVGVNLDFDEFDDLTDNSDTKKYAHHLVDTFNPSNIQYHAIDYVFNQFSWLPSRFGTGAYPVWYAACDLITSFYETLEHYKSIYLQKPQFKIMPDIIQTGCSVFIVQCDAALIDLRNKVIEHPELIDRDPLHYETTQKIGLRVHQEGYPGLLVRSARMFSGENIAVFRKNILSNPKHFQNYFYEFNQKNNTEIVKSISGEVILER